MVSRVETRAFSSSKLLTTSQKVALFVTFGPNLARTPPPFVLRTEDTFTPLFSDLIL